MQKMGFSIGLNGQIWLKRLFVAMATPFFFQFSYQYYCLVFIGNI